eukprot:8848899-Alexandrium_andersonii.AAC.1
MTPDMACCMPSKCVCRLSDVTGGPFGDGVAPAPAPLLGDLLPVREDAVGLFVASFLIDSSPLTLPFCACMTRIRIL